MLPAFTYFCLDNKARFEATLTLPGSGLRQDARPAHILVTILDPTAAGWAGRAWFWLLSRVVDSRCSGNGSVPGRTGLSKRRFSLNSEFLPLSTPGGVVRFLAVMGLLRCSSYGTWSSLAIKSVVDRVSSRSRNSLCT